ncbi:MAG: AI-2E family transporter [Muribaculaceae bacterium]|nr:AI-2E family transporter [Muribaculaceae bacterium]
MDKMRYPVRQPYTFDRVVRIVFSVIGIIATLYILDALKGVLLPFFVACLISYMLEPAVKWNMRMLRLKHRFIPVVLTLLEACLIVSVFGLLFIPYLIDEAEQMAVMVKHYASAKIEIPYISGPIYDFLKENLDYDTISRLLTPQEWKELLRTALTSSWNFLSSGLSFVIGALSWLIVILYVLFIMLDYERIMLSFKQLVPMPHRRQIYQIGRDIERAMNRYFRNQFFISMIVGVLFSIGFLIIGLPMGVVLGLFIGCLNMVPYLQLISLPITAILCLVSTASTGVNFWAIFWESMAVYIIVQLIQDVILTPKIMGKAMGLNPAIILLSLSVWGALLGFMGLIIALPLTTLLLSYYNIYIVDRYARPEVEIAESDPIEGEA